MKKTNIYILVIIVTGISMLAACTKCVECVPYKKATGLVSTSATTVKSCYKPDITAYEKIPYFIDGNNDTVTFVCK